MRAIKIISVIFSLLALLQQGNALDSNVAADEGCVVTDFGKVSEAIKSCKNIVLDSIKVPGGETLKLHLNDGSTVTFRGETVFGYAPWKGPLVEVNGTNVVIQGEEGALLNGQGKNYWDGKGEWGSIKPQFFVIQLYSSIMQNISVLNAPIHCVLLTDSIDVQLLNWKINNTAGDPEVAGKDKAGHNTDGFDILNGTNIRSVNCDVYTQDDCIAIRSGDRISVDKMGCYGGHGLSISVGFSNDSIAANTLSNVIISNSVVIKGENGIHIKNHVDAGTGSITNVTYKNIVLSKLTNYGINIQENYKNLPANSTQPAEAKNNILMKYFSFENITGSVESSAIPIYINCAKDGCFNWNFTNVVINGTKPNNCNFEPPNFSCKSKPSQPSQPSQSQSKCVVNDFANVPEAITSCKNIVLDSIEVPAGETLKLILNDGTSVTFKGETVFGYASWKGPLVAIRGKNITIQGEKGAILNGQGHLHWDGKGSWGSMKPSFFEIKVFSSILKNITVLNSPVHCVLLSNSVDVEFINWKINNSAGNPEVVGKDKAGHNTDGFGIHNSTNIHLLNCEVDNQDDCVVLKSGSNILVERMVCREGHGLSISAGFSNDSIEINSLSNVTVTDSILEGGQNGIHIKTHVDAGFGVLDNITYKNIVIKDVDNYGINVQQNYKNLPANSNQPAEARNNIPIINLTFENITGSVDSSAIPIYINCAEEGCFNWNLTDIDVKGNLSNNCNFLPANFTC